jgi:hypothetical protein
VPPWLPPQTEYLSLFPAAVHAVAQALEAAQPGAAARLLGAGAEPAPTPWPLGEAPDPQSPAGQLLALWRDLPEPDSGDRGPIVTARDSLSRLNRAIWHASYGEWHTASGLLQRAMKTAQKATRPAA